MYRTVGYEKVPNSDIIRIILCEETTEDIFTVDPCFFDVNNRMTVSLPRKNFTYTRNGNILIGSYLLNPTAFPTDAAYLQCGDFRWGENGVRGNKRGYL